MHKKTPLYIYIYIYIEIVKLPSLKKGQFRPFLRSNEMQYPAVGNEI